jgi:transcriptional regulator with XRE-family HTH domain
LIRAKSGLIAAASEKRQEEIALPICGQYTDHVQALFLTDAYAPDMAKVRATRLRQLRQAAGLSLRELARQIGQEHSNVVYWETSGNFPRSDMLLPIAKALGVTVDELLGESRPKRVLSPGGKMRQLFEAASKLPRSQQEKVLAVLEPFVAQHANGGAK